MPPWLIPRRCRRGWWRFDGWWRLLLQFYEPSAMTARACCLCVIMPWSIRFAYIAILGIIIARIICRIVDVAFATVVFPRATTASTLRLWWGITIGGRTWIAWWRSVIPIRPICVIVCRGTCIIVIMPCITTWITCKLWKRNFWPYGHPYSNFFSCAITIKTSSCSFTPYTLYKSISTRTIANFAYPISSASKTLFNSCFYTTITILNHNKYVVVMCLSPLFSYCSSICKSVGAVIRPIGVVVIRTIVGCNIIVAACVCKASPIRTG